VKLSVWAEENVSYRAALNWFHAGTLPVPERELATGTIFVDPPGRDTGVSIVYCRVTSHEQKADIERQAGRVLVESSKRGLSIDRVVTEIGSGLNGRRSAARRAAAAVYPAGNQPGEDES
jgi:putative resolvase